MAEVDVHDLQDYFSLYEEYQQTEDPKLTNELDRKLSQYKDRFHKDAGAVLKLLLDRQNDFVDRYEIPYKDLVFDLEMHAKSVEEIKKTHTYDAEHDMWVPIN